MKRFLVPGLSCLVLTLTGCAAGNTAPGSVSARINDGRSQRGAIVTDSSYQNQHRQRVNEAEEYRLRHDQRRDQQEAILAPLETFSRATQLLNLRVYR